MTRRTASAQTPLRQDSNLQFQIADTLFEFLILFFQTQNVCFQFL